jgi:Mg-chelatase subunit ChlD
MGIGRLAGWLLSCLVVSGATVTDADRLVISQAHPQLPVMTVYLDIVDAAGKPVSGLTPASLSATLGSNTAQVADVQTFQSSGEGVAYAFLIDISKSMGVTQFAEVRSALQTWVAGMKPADRAAICTFGEGYRLVTDFTADKQKLNEALSSLAPSDLHTRLNQALDRALEFEQRTDPGLPARRVIVVLSDGKDEGSALTPGDVLVKVRASHLPIYSIGLSHLPRAEKQRYLDALYRFSNASGGVYEEADAQSVPQTYAAIQQAILRIFVVHLVCTACKADGLKQPLEITLTQGARGLKAAPLDVVLVAGPQPPPTAAVEPSWWSRIPIWLWLLSAAAVLCAAGYALVRKPLPPEPAIPKGGGKESVGPTVPALISHDEPESGEGMPMRLTVVAGQNAGSSYEVELKNKVVIGRDKDCNVVLADPEVSNRHCELALVHGQVLVYDLGSTNSTYVNGVPIHGRHKLEPLDTIAVGDTELRVHFEET